MVSCTIKDCSSRSAKKCHDKPLRFFGIPGVITRECDKTLLYSRARRAIWLERINQSRKLHHLGEIEESDIKPHTKVCSRHFASGQPSRLLDAKNVDWAPWCNLGYKIEDPVEEQELKIAEFSGRVTVQKRRASEEDDEPPKLQRNDQLQNNIVLRGSDGVLPKNDCVVQRNNIVLQRNDSLLLRKDVVPQRNSSLLRRNNIVLQNKDGVFQRNDVVVPRNDDDVFKNSVVEFRNNDVEQKVNVVVPRNNVVVHRNDDVLHRNNICNDRNWPMWQQSAGSDSHVKVEVFDNDFMHWVGVPECTSNMESEGGVTSVSVQTEVGSSTVGVQTDLTGGDYVLKSEFDSVTRDNVALRSELNSLKQFVMTEQQLSENNALVKFYTGLPTFSMMKHVLSLVSPQIAQSHRNALSQFQQLLIILMRLRLNLLEQDLAFRFGVSQTTVSKTYEKWLRPMSICFQEFIPWPQRDSYEESPAAFKTAFETKVVVIVTYFNLVCDRIKHNKTVRFLIGMTTLGKICFVSKGWVGLGGTDQDLVESSGILDKLEPGDVLIADKGLTIAGCEGMYQPNPNVPIFTKGKTKLPDENVLINTTICVRTHAERVNVLVRQKFRILQNPVNVELLTAKPWEKEPSLDFIVSICCALTYLCPTGTDD